MSHLTSRYETPEAALRACAAGDRLALRALYEQEAPQMLGVAIRILRRRALAEEVLQDAFLAIWNNAMRFESGNARGWMYTILRNRALNVLRGEARTDLIEDFDQLEQPSADETPEEIMSRLSDESALKRCLALLDAARRKIVVLAYTEGLSHGEIAARLGVPLGTIKSWLRRSLLSLKACMG